MRRLLIIALTGTAACAVDTSTITQHYCTQEDIDNGTCQDPGGGSPPYTLPEDTSDYASRVVTSGGFTPLAESRVCPTHNNCVVRVDLWAGRWLEIQCWIQPDDSEYCVVWNCEPSGVCTAYGHT